MSINKALLEALTYGICFPALETFSIESKNYKGHTYLCYSGYIFIHAAYCVYLNGEQKWHFEFTYQRNMTWSTFGRHSCM
jgi:hypothetical protein